MTVAANSITGFLTVQRPLSYNLNQFKPDMKVQAEVHVFVTPYAFVLVAAYAGFPLFQVACHNFLSLVQRFEPFKIMLSH